MADGVEDEDELSAPFAGLISTLTERASAAGGTLPEAEVHEAFDALVMALDTQLDEPDLDSPIIPSTAVFLSWLAAGGVELTVEDISETEFEKMAGEALRIVAGERSAELTHGQSDDGAALDAFSVWQRDVGGHRTLSREEEAVYTYRIALLTRTEAALVGALVRRQADPLLERAAADEISQSLRLTIEDARRERLRLEGEFLSFNYKLAMKWAMKIHAQSGRRVSLEDLIQQGNEGMLESLRRFNVTLGHKFSTFAVWQIREKMTSFSYEQGSAILVKQHRQRDLSKIRRLRHLYAQEHLREMSVEELAEAMNRTPEQIGAVLRTAALLQSSSLDRPVGENEDSASLGDLVADPLSIDPMGALVDSDTRARLMILVDDTLNIRERRVIYLRFGLYDGVQKRTLEQIGDRMNVTRERVRQIEARALAKLSAQGGVRELAGRSAEVSPHRWQADRRAA